MSEARIHPPSEQRLSEARRLGHVPRAPVVGLFAVASSLLLGLCLSAPWLHEACATLLRAPLESTARGELVSLSHLWRLTAWPLLGSIALMLACAFVALALGTFIAQGPAFGFAGRSRLRLSPLSPPRLSPLLFALGLPLIALQLLPRALRVDAAGFADVLRDFALHAAAYLAACALLDAALARAAHLRSLWLTRKEHQDEQREAYGSPEIRRAREHLRRTSAREARP